MRNLGLTLALAATTFAAPALAQVREPELLKPTGKWVIDFDRDRCSAFIEFAEGDDAVVARFTRYAPGDAFTLSLYGKRVRSPARKVRATVDFGLGAPQPANIALSGHVGKVPALFFSSGRLDNRPIKVSEANPPAVTPAQEAMVTGITVAIRGKAPFRLATGSLAKPMATMRECTRGLVESWGYDPDIQATLSRPVTPAVSAAGWLVPEDYPVKALEQGESGLVQTRFDVDAEGRITGCRVLDRTEPDAFGEIVCSKIARRATMRPALDAQGKPVRAYYLYTIQFAVGS